MSGILYPLLAGIFIALQTVFNARISEKIGLWETTTYVHIVGLIVAASLMFIFGKGSLGKLNEVNKLYLISGAFGVVIVYSIAKGTSLVGVSLSISVLLISQLLVATLIDIFGLFGTEAIKLHFTKPLGLVLMIAGLIVFKLKG